MLSRRLLLAGLALVSALASVPVMAQQTDALPHGTTARPSSHPRPRPRHHDAGQPRLRGARIRLATFDQDGTLWVEHPIYSQVVFALDRVAALAPEHPEWKDKEPFKTVLSGDREAIAKLSLRDLEEIVFATHTGMDVEAFTTIASDWAAKAQDHRWHRPYTQLVYQPMLELLSLLRANGYRTYIVTGGGQDFVRSYARARLRRRRRRRSSAPRSTSSTATTPRARAC